MLEAVKRDLVAAARDGRQTVVVGHHPLETRGPHGGFASLGAHLFPFSIMGDYVPVWTKWIPMPGLGSLMAWGRACCSPSSQDLPDSRNRHLRSALRGALQEAARAGGAPLLYAAGHDHSLQLFEGDGAPRYTAVSGLGSSSKASGVGHAENTLFAHSNPEHPGFMVVDFFAEGSVRLAIVEWTEGEPGGVEVYAAILEGALGATASRHGKASDE